MTWKLGSYRGDKEIQVYQYHLHWTLKSVNVLYIGTFGSLWQGFRIAVLGFRMISTNSRVSVRV